MQEQIIATEDQEHSGSRGGPRLTQAVVAHLYRVPIDDLFATTRGGPRAAFARQIAMYLMHVVYGLTLHQVGMAFGRDRSTVSYACHRVEDLREDPRFDHHLRQLETLLRGAGEIEVGL